ncbi:hypothetical protein H2201_001574 [Coniosporium apollinis]|uniref:Nicotinamide N-methyltransferase n=1 Tax=Coniosporium apollinis TaxID=61459 RepID=A0ABQ9P0L2_9PEZI|nr:hypothetical protein H2201_001574 [Coniosporium apollinis]
MLPSLLRLHPRDPTTSTDAPPDPETIFSAALGTIFTDDVRNQHGDPENVIVYNSVFGELEFRTADPAGEEERRRFAHYLWNAGVTISDYPAPEVLANLAENISKNVSDHLRSRVSIEGHEWGDLSTPFALANACRFTRILAADCLWMPYEHHNLARSMLHFLSPAEDARVFVMAGFHTGRAKLAPFFEEVVGQEGLEVEEIREVDADGERREWVTEREGEGVAERKKWTVVARLKRKS